MSVAILFLLKISVLDNPINTKVDHMMTFYEMCLMRCMDFYISCVGYLSEPGTCLIPHMFYIPICVTCPKQDLAYSPLSTWLICNMDHHTCPCLFPALLMCDNFVMHLKYTHEYVVELHHFTLLSHPLTLDLLF